MDVYPQASQLRLTINMQFHEIDDPRHLCRDITGHRLNGDVALTLKKLEELPYIMGLVRQAFEKQMGNGEVEA